MAKLNPKAVLKPAVSLFLICLIVTALLAGVNMLTADRIAALAVQTAEAVSYTHLAAFRQLLRGLYLLFSGYSPLVQAKHGCFNLL